MIRESKIEQYLRYEVLYHGGRAIKFTSSSLRSLPDRICLFPNGLALFVEVKAPGRKPNEGQLAMIKELRRLGFLAVYVDGRPQVDALMAWLRQKYGLVRNVPQKGGKRGHVQTFTERTVQKGLKV